MTEWKKYKLGDLLDVKRGASLSGEYYATEGQYIRLTCGNFDYNQNCFKENTSKDNIFYIGQVRPEFIMKKGDIITPLTEQAIGLLGSTAIIPESDKYIQSQDVAKIICKEGKLYPAFAFYLVSSAMVKTQLSAGAQQTKIRHTSPDKIKDCSVWVPSYETQKRIASVLSNIDRKIALNRAMNEELEQTARDLYDYWFLQFDFPDANGKPYRSSGGKMVYNPQLKREIPEGWEVESVNDLCASQRGVSYDKSNELSEGGVLVFRGNNIENNHLIYDSNIVRIPKELISDAQHIRKYDIVMTMSSGSKEHIGKSMMFQSDSPYTYGAFLNKFIPQASCEHFIFDFFKSPYFKAKIKRICSGTGINNLTTKNFDDVLLPMPNHETLVAYSNIAKKLYEQYGCNEQEIDNLTSLRDELLPLLMNGQVEVKE